MADTADARLIAYGKLIEALPGLLNAEGRAALCDWLAERQVMHDGQEDPGAVIVEGLEVELAIAQVFRDLSERFECRQP
ncbi:hypothetical protein ACFOM8_14715 [Paracoccus angustae]|uniref:Uncharacterized protein n=1 Tax=Paracoccus angustae TaxID=1671480 RepID=A0ABV7U6X5_9RHOB